MKSKYGIFNNTEYKIVGIVDSDGTSATIDVNGEAVDPIAELAKYDGYDVTITISEKSEK